jgi:uncharacterized protein DUF1931
MPVMNVARFERFFRAAGALDVDKADVRRYNDFVAHELYDLLVRGKAAAKTNGRDIIEPADLPITRGLQESIERYREIDGELELQPILDGLADLPPLEYPYSDQTRAELPGIAGGLSVALARSFRIVAPGVKNPQAQHWERAFAVFDLLL